MESLSHELSVLRGKEDTRELELLEVSWQFRQNKDNDKVKRELEWLEVDLNGRGAEYYATKT